MHQPQSQHPQVGVVNNTLPIFKSRSWSKSEAQGKSSVLMSGGLELSCWHLFLHVSADISDTSLSTPTQDLLDVRGLLFAQSQHIPNFIKLIHPNDKNLISLLSYLKIVLAFYKHWPANFNPKTFQFSVELHSSKERVSITTVECVFGGLVQILSVRRSCSLFFRAELIQTGFQRTRDFV